MTTELTSPVSGLDLSCRDTRVRVQDDLFAHVNGRWLATHEIPEDRAVDGAIRALFDRAESDVRQIIQDADGPPGSEARKIADLYASFLDTQTVAERGLKPLVDELAAVAHTTDRALFARLLGELQRTGVAGAVALYVDTDDKNSRRYLVNLAQSGIGLPDESYYRAEEYASVRAAYIAHIDSMFALAREDEQVEELLAPGAVGERIFETERLLAAGHWDVVRRREADLGYNPTTFSQLIADYPEFDWLQWFGGLAAGVDVECAELFGDLSVRQPDYLRTFARLWAEHPLEEWQLWLQWRILHARAPLSTEALVAENFDFYGRTLTGATQNRERWKRAVSLVQDIFGEAVGKLYVAEHFPPQAKARVLELSHNLLEAYRQRIIALDWMGQQTKKAALAKLAKFTLKIGYPDRWRDYSSVIVDASDLMGNYRRGYAADHDRELRKLTGPVDRDEWFMTPQTVNAYNNPGMNEIVFPAAILQPPFFDMNADDAANYGGIGAVIGHEIGHGFDDQGSKYDGDGNMVDWWTDADRAEFQKRTSALIDQYNALSPADLPDDQRVNGALTIGENIGDLGGLSIALYAYGIAGSPGASVVLDGLTGLQRVFYAWAQIWRTVVRPQEAVRRLTVDVHSPPEFRCNAVVRNITAFHEAFDTQPTDALYLPPSERVTIW